MWIVHFNFLNQLLLTMQLCINNELCSNMQYVQSLSIREVWEWYGPMIIQTVLVSIPQQFSVLVNTVFLCQVAYHCRLLCFTTCLRYLPGELFHPHATTIFGKTVLKHVLK